ncbi:MAG: hypothetical protein ACRC6U_06400 [Fusobacteriaceae bacterium]
MKFVIYALIINIFYLFLYPLHLNIFFRLFISGIITLYFFKVEQHPSLKKITITFK